MDSNEKGKFVGKGNDENEKEVERKETFRSCSSCGLESDEQVMVIDVVEEKEEQGDKGNRDVQSSEFDDLTSLQTALSMKEGDAKADDASQRVPVNIPRQIISLSDLQRAVAAAAADEKNNHNYHASSPMGLFIVLESSSDACKDSSTKGVESAAGIDCSYSTSLRFAASAENTSSSADDSSPPSPDSADDRTSEDAYTFHMALGDLMGPIILVWNGIDSLIKYVELSIPNYNKVRPELDNLINSYRGIKKGYQTFCKGKKFQGVKDILIATGALMSCLGRIVTQLIPVYGRLPGVWLSLQNLGNGALGIRRTALRYLRGITMSRNQSTPGNPTDAAAEDDETEDNGQSSHSAADGGDP